MIERIHRLAYQIGSHTNIVIYCNFRTLFDGLLETISVFENITSFRLFLCLKLQLSLSRTAADILAYCREEELSLSSTLNLNVNLNGMIFPERGDWNRREGSAVLKNLFSYVSLLDWVLPLCASTSSLSLAEPLANTNRSHDGLKKNSRLGTAYWCGEGYISADKYQLPRLWSLQRKTSHFRDCWGYSWDVKPKERQSALYIRRSHQLLRNLCRGSAPFTHSARCRHLEDYQSTYDQIKARSERIRCLRTSIPSRQSSPSQKSPPTDRSILTTSPCGRNRRSHMQCKWYLTPAEKSYSRTEKKTCASIFAVFKPPPISPWMYSTQKRATSHFFHYWERESGAHL